jgi:predicted enzyme related to lactoylglutathione lyase
MRCAATIYVKHLEPMALFYEACFGLEDVADAPGDYRVLESEIWTLSIVQVPEDVAATIKLSHPPIRREETPIKLSFDVPSIAAARATITDLGGQVDDLEWEFRGFRHCDCIDPEGNVNQLREAVTTSR